MRNISDKNFFSGTHTNYEIMWKNMVRNTQATDDNITWHKKGVIWHAG
jgi:hypothetical protein